MIRGENEMKSRLAESVRSTASWSTRVGPYRHQSKLGDDPHRGVTSAQRNARFARATHVKRGAVAGRCHGTERELRR